MADSGRRWPSWNEATRARTEMSEQRRRWTSVRGLVNPRHGLWLLPQSFAPIEDQSTECHVQSFRGHL
ncbi:hypothetical protein Nmel_018471 [Mimus melanotis]